MIFTVFPKVGECRGLCGWLVQVKMRHCITAHLCEELECSLKIIVQESVAGTRCRVCHCASV